MNKIGRYVRVKCALYTWVFVKYLQNVFNHQLYYSQSFKEINMGYFKQKQKTLYSFIISTKCYHAKKRNMKS